MLKTTHYQNVLVVPMSKMIANALENKFIVKRYNMNHLLNRKETPKFSISQMYISLQTFSGNNHMMSVHVYVRVYVHYTCQ